MEMLGFFFMAKDLIARLDDGPVLCAEGYLFAMERRGYLQEYSCSDL